MKIFVKVTPGSKKERIERIDQTHVAVWTKAPAREGKANTAAAKALADYFGIPRSMIKLVAGFKSKQKLFEIP